jgi:hypothetical protein
MCISTPVAVKLGLSTLINHAIIITVAKVLVTARDTQYHFCFKGSYMADENGVPELDEASKAAYNMGALQDKIDQANDYYSKVMRQITKLKDENMAEILNPSGMMMTGGGDGGLFGGGGLIGGLILGSLLRNNGNLLGGDGAGAAAALRSPPEQVTANMSLMQAIGAVDKSVSVNAAAFEASQATQSLGLTTQFNNQTAALSSQLMTLQQEVMTNRYELSKDISNDGEKTRALIVAQYEASLNRQLTDANAEIIALKNRSALDSATNGITLTNTNNINQMQQQSQQQQQYAHLAQLIYGLGQNITNGAINVGSGTLTANPVNTNTSIR